MSPEPQPVECMSESFGPAAVPRVLDISDPKADVEPREATYEEDLEATSLVEGVIILGTLDASSETASGPRSAGSPH